VQIKAWGDKSVIYHPESGNTFLLNGQYAHILELILSGVSDESLNASIASDFKLESGDDVSQLINQARETFARLKLISE
jgi:PqqD family protein of HPr-rel-A system